MVIYAPDLTRIAMMNPNSDPKRILPRQLKR